MSNEKEGNPFLTKNFGSVLDTSSSTMTIGGTMGKTLLLLAILVVSAVYAYTMAFSSGMLMGAALGAFILAMIATFNPKQAVWIGPVYSVLEGLVVGAVSTMADAKYPGVAMQAFMATIGVFFVMLLLYSKKIIVVDSTYIKGIVGAMVGILIFYVADMLLALFGVPLPAIAQNSTVSIGFSIFVVAIAALSLAIDFEMIKQNTEMNAPKYMEWYSALGLMISLVWLYLEILRLLQKSKK